MRTPAGLSIRKLAWPRKVIDTAPSGTPPARRNGPDPPATTPVHAACAADPIMEPTIIMQTSRSRITRRSPRAFPLRGSLPLPARGERAGVRGNPVNLQHNLDEVRAGGSDSLSKAVV